MTLPGETPAALAMLRTVVFVNPCSANSAMAAERIFSAVSGDECGERVGGASEFFERMFNIKRVFNLRCQALMVSAREQHKSARAAQISACSANQWEQGNAAHPLRFGGPSTIRRAHCDSAGDECWFPRGGFKRSLQHPVIDRVQTTVYPGPRPASPSLGSYGACC